MAGKVRWILGLFGLAASGAAMAHVGNHAAGGFAGGWTHPFMGLDHLLAMVAVGVWAAQLGNRFRYLLPATFVTVMAAGAILGAQGLALPHVESAIALSVLMLGALVAAAVKAGSLWPVALVAAFAVLHGHAHGTEMPAFQAPWLYFAGFLAATAILHAAGVAAAIALKERAAMVRLGGAAIGLTGSWLLVSGLLG